MPRAFDPQQAALWATKAFVGVIALLSLFVALVVPYHATDALVYGELSRHIGEHGGFLFDGVGYPSYSRPLFYVPQGWLWWLFGWQEWIGRLWSLVFFALLVWGLFRLARDRSLPASASWLTLLVLLACPDAVVQAFAGQTDIPVAAMLTVLAVLLWRWEARPRTALLIVLVAAGAVLAKATALPALAGLAVACFLGDRAGLRDRLRLNLLPLVAGTLLGLVYGVVMARHFGLALDQFLGGVVGDGGSASANATASLTPAAGTLPSGQAASGVTDRVADGLSDFFGSDRDSILLRAEWLGPYLRLLLIYALVYALARVVGAAHRIAGIAALVVGVLGYFLGPTLLPGGELAFDTSTGARIATILLLVPLAAVVWCPAEQHASRLLCGRLLLMAIPPLLAWGVFGILADTRTLSPAWPALFVLCGGVLAMGVSGLATRSAWVAGAAVLLVIGLGLLDFRNFDGLGARPDGTINALRAFKDLTPNTWLHPNAARAAADPQLAGEVDGVNRFLPAGRPLLTNDGRMIYYALGRTKVGAPPTTCAEVGDAGLMVLLLNVPTPPEIPTLTQCLELVDVEQGSFGVWRVAATP